MCLRAHEYLVVSLGAGGFSKDNRSKQPGRQEENQEGGVPEDERGIFQGLNGLLDQTVLRG